MYKSELKFQINHELIGRLKKDVKLFNKFLVSQSEGNIIFLLERLGRIENKEIKFSLLSMIRSKSESVRALSVKNLAKLDDISLLNIFLNLAKNDSSTFVRRESVSAIGRLRDEKAIPILIELLTDNDPKVVMQALRGLLVFSKNNFVKNEISKLITHPNELINEIVKKEMKDVSSKSKKIDRHDKFPEFLKNTSVLGDTLDVLPNVPDESVHLTFTSPPYYNARDYSIYQSYSEYLLFLEKVFKEVYRVTKEGRFFVLNTSPIIIPRISRAHSSKRYPIPYDIHPILVKMGWEFIDDIVWLKPEYSVKNRNAGFFQHRKPLGYKPNAITEMLMVYRKKTDKLIDWNIHQYEWGKISKSKIGDKYETTNVWRIDPTFNKIHSAVFPIELCDRVIKYYSYVEDLVFDPFAGSGTLGKSALKLNRSFFLIEKGQRYFNNMKEELMKNVTNMGITNEYLKFMNTIDFNHISYLKK